MNAFESLRFPQDDRLWHLRAWLLERAIVLMAGDWRWALFGMACRTMSAGLAQARLWIGSIRC
jgi:hypothetical protein